MEEVLKAAVKIHMKADSMSAVDIWTELDNAFQADHQLTDELRRKYFPEDEGKWY